MSKTLHQSKFISEFNSECKEKFNERILTKSDEDLIKAMTETIKSIERDQLFIIRVEDVMVIQDYDEIQRVLAKFVANKDFYDPSAEYISKNISMETTDFYLMIVRFYIQVKGEPNGMVFERAIILPRVVNKYYFRISNQYYNIIYHVSDCSIYNNALALQENAGAKKLNPYITLILLFTPLTMEKHVRILPTENYGNISCIDYTIKPFAKTISAFKYTLAKLGLCNALSFYDVYGVHILNHRKTDLRNEEDYYIIQIKNKRCEDDIYMYINKYIYDNDQAIQSVVYAIYDALSNFKVKSLTFTYSDLFTPELWAMAISVEFATKDPTLAKINNVLSSLEGIYDIRSSKLLALPIEDKKTIYHVIRWMTREFNTLYCRDRLDVQYKRVHWAENIAAIYSQKVSKNIFDKLSRGNITLEDVHKVLKIQPDIIMSTLRHRNKFRYTSYSNLVNDLDSITALEYTIKDNVMTKNAKAKQYPKTWKYVHPSHIGRFDMESSPKSDPGLGGQLAPMVDLYGEYNKFSDFKEPNEYRSNVENIMKECGYTSLYEGVTPINSGDAMLEPLNRFREPESEKMTGLYAKKGGETND